MIQWEYLARTFVADKDHEVVIQYLQTELSRNELEGTAAARRADA